MIIKKIKELFDKVLTARKYVIHFKQVNNSSFLKCSQRESFQKLTASWNWSLD